MRKLTKSIAILMAMLTLSVLMSMAVMASVEAEYAEYGMYTLTNIHTTADRHAETKASSVRQWHEPVGSVIELTPQNGNDWVFVGWGVAGVEEYEVCADGILTFVMPNNNITITDNWERYTPAVDFITRADRSETKRPFISFPRRWFVLWECEQLITLLPCSMKMWNLVSCIGGDVELLPCFEMTVYDVFNNEGLFSARLERHIPFRP